MPQGTNEKGTAPSSDRANQPKRAGGNSAAFGIEKHNQAKSAHVKQGGAGEKTIGKNSTWGFAFNSGGNSAKGSGEQHGNQKRDSLHGSSRDIPSNVSVSQRKEGAGNSQKGGHEPTARGSATVPASRRFNS